ncbi:signal recognition particle-docking protein FtsY [Pseudomonas sp. CC6-YY-74]|uniref:signal recognition particle-docking protein FtsY n=1 Tax=Pseudomonas sp. CC6-YY-74 TaxID=1930532 RepID=UPI0009A1938E|nr:signal recognition particle-docking protein FtsY [Pseudomonas sp. CC6-YY-74]
MFGSNDDKKTPAPSATPPVPATAEKPAEKPVEKKDLFGWLRKKPQEPASSQLPVAPEPTPAPEPQASVAETAAPAVEPLAPPASAVPAMTPTPTPTPTPTESVAEPVQAPRPSRFRINAGSEVLHPVAHQPEPEPPTPVPVPVPVAPIMEQPAGAEALAEQNKPGDNQGGWFARLKLGLSKTSASLGEGMASLFLGKKAIDDELFEELETRLLTADVGVEATNLIIQSLTQKVARKQLTDSGALYQALQDELTALLKPVEQPLHVDQTKQPYVILVVGVNGAGKTTTIGKLAKKLQQDGKKVMLAAGDTFRAAAVEQLQVWGERNQIPVIAQHTGADSASVIFDAVQAAKARGMDVLIADTAGRLHTKDNLMEELKKVRRVIGKLDDTAPHEVLLVLDAGTGQNAINQTKQFNQTVNLTGLVLTKLDGTAKGGVIFALAKQFGLPIRYIGVGEGIDDLRTFEANSFVQALFQSRES